MSCAPRTPAISMWVDYVDGNGRLTVFDYNRTTKVLTPTVFAGTLAVLYSDSEQTGFVIDGEYAAFVNNLGHVHAGQFDLFRGGNPRLEFMHRDANDVVTMLAHLSQDGTLHPREAVEGTIGGGTDQFIFYDLVAIDATGLLTAAKLWEINLFNDGDYVGIPEYPLVTT